MVRYQWEMERSVVVPPSRPGVQVRQPTKYYVTTPIPTTGGISLSCLCPFVGLETFGDIYPCNVLNYWYFIDRPTNICGVDAHYSYYYSYY